MPNGYSLKSSQSRHSCKKRLFTINTPCVRVDATILTVCSEIVSAGTTISIVFGADMVEIEKKECDTEEVC